eukprot:scaffold28159_cov94-Isochrysis_galbana.AAC.2
MQSLGCSVQPIVQHAYWCTTQLAPTPARRLSRTSQRGQHHYLDAPDPTPYRFRPPVPPCGGAQAVDRKASSSPARRSAATLSARSTHTPSRGAIADPFPPVKSPFLPTHRAFLPAEPTPSFFPPGESARPPSPPPVKSTRLRGEATVRALSRRTS